MAPRMDVLSKEKKEHPPSIQPSLSTASQAEAVAARYAGMVVNDDDATDASTPPSTPPPAAAPPVIKKQESALKRLAGRLRGHGRQQRSLSAPPALRRRRAADKLLEEHFVLEESTTDQKPVVLPGVPKHEDNWARDLHDFFNLIMLIPVVALNMMNWNWEMLLYKSGEMDNLSDAWEGDWFYAFFYVTTFYFVADLAWMLLCPHCVRSPGVIIQHHIATLLYIYVPFAVPQCRWCMGACMSVEINTWLLIARRVFNKQGFPPWTIIDLSFFSFRVKLISILFYITWIGIRCILYPYLLVDIWRMYMEYSEMQNTYLNLILVCFPLQIVFCALNLKWSNDLLMSKIRYWRRKDTGAGVDNAKDKGL